MSRRRTRMATSALVGALSIALALPASADEPPPPEDRAGRHSSDEREPVETARAGTPSGYFTVDQRSVPVAPGLRHSSFDQYDARGWVRVDVLTADLATPGLRLDYAWNGKVAATAPLPSQLRRDKAIAGVNADFFDIGDTGAPLGMGVDRQRGVLHGVTANRNLTFNVTRDDVGRIAQTFLRAEISRRSRPPIPVTNLNSPTVTPGGIGIYTPAWGAVSRRRVTPGPAGREVRVVNGRVRSNDKTLSNGPIPSDTVELVGVGKGAKALSRLRKGQRIGVEYGLTDESVRVAVGGNAPLLRNGEINAPGDPALHPRTAIGVDEDTGQVLIVTVDGRQSSSRGLTLRETAALMKQLGAEDALNLDGGGSSTMVARESGESSVVVNSPSDGRLRPVANGLGFAVTNGSGRLRGLRIEPVGDYEDSHRVLRGLSRRLVARGHDEALTRVRSKPSWGGSPEVSVRRRRAPRTVVVGRRPGTGVVTASAGRATGEFRIDVLGRVHRLEASVPSVALAGKRDRHTVEVRGYDAQGFGTWVEPRDVKLSYNRAKLQVTRSGRGFTISSRVGSASDVVAISAGGATTYVGVTVGLARQVADRMNRTDGWAVSSYPSVASARLSRTQDRAGRAGRALALDYRFARSRRTRAAYLDAKPPRELSRALRRVGVWVRGDGQGAWLRMVVKDASGTRSTLNLARRVTWKGWRLVTAPVPSGLSEPVDLVRIYAAEPDRKRAYRGTLAFDDLTVWTERTAPTPVTAPLRDPLVADQETLPAGGTRVAVLGDAGLRGNRINSPAARRARRTMREAVASGAELVLINGDLVARGGTGELNVAKRLIDQELDGKVAWRYLPGDGEVDGSGDLSTYRAVFGNQLQTFDRSGTRFVLLNTARGSLRLGGFQQLLDLRSDLAAAERDASIHSVVVVGHHPPSDPVAGGSAEIADPREGDLVQDLLTGFRAGSGKNIAYVGSHGRRFGAVRHDDVPMLLAGPVRNPTRVGLGSFAGWSLLRVDPQAPEWLGAEFRASVDDLWIKGPDEMRAGTNADAPVLLRQLRLREVVGYPMNAVYGGSRSMHIGPAAGAPQGAVAAYTPATRTLTALSPGTARLTVTVNGRTAEKQVTVR